MSGNLKRVIFWSLVLLFITDTAIIYCSGSDYDFGKAFLTDDSKKGKLLFQEYNCISCHQLYGLGGYMGTDLTNVISTVGKGETYAKSFLSYGTQRMPNFHLNRDQIKDLLAYLTYVDKTGISPVINFETKLDGSIMQKDSR